MNESEFTLALVAKRTRLSPQLIRAWEARHAAVTPRRAENGRRLYTAEDVTRLQKLRGLTQIGFSIGRIAVLPLAELETLAARELPTESTQAVRAAPHAVNQTTAEDFVGTAMEAISRLDGAGLIAALESADVALGKPAFLQDVVAEIAEQVGAAWRNGRLKVAHEHFATAQLRGYLGPFGRVTRESVSTPHLVVTTLPEQWHEIGALLVAAAAHAYGWRVTYLGPSMPVEEIAGAALGFAARAVALSIVYPSDDPQLAQELRHLRRLLPDSIALLVGGGGSGSYASIFTEVGARHLPDLRALYPALDDLRQVPQA